MIGVSARIAHPRGLLGAAVAMLFLVPSGAHAISTRTLATFTGATGDSLGYSVASAGDVNGDGYDDQIVGAPLNDAAGVNAGRAYVFFGGKTPDAAPDMTLTGAAPNDHFGWSVASAGDVNGDGYDDVIVGAPLNDAGGTDAGRAYIYFGGPTPDATPDLILNGTNGAGENFGWSVASPGDLQGDGYSEWLVGAPLSGAGRVYYYTGAAVPDNSSEWFYSNGPAGDRFGWSVSGAGDVNGDGALDLIIGAPLNDNVGVDAGRAYIFLCGGLTDLNPDVVLQGAVAGDNFGRSVASAGDVNGDGYDDTIVGAWMNDAAGANAGRAYVFYGGLSGGDVTADLTLTGLAAGDEFGESVASAGDVNHDGYPDLVVGAPLDNQFGFLAGRAYVYFGGASPDQTADLVFGGTSSNESVGYSVASAGDANHDGFADLIIGGYLNDSNGSDNGRAYLIAPYFYEVLSPNGGERWVAGQPATVRWRGHDVADLSISIDGGLNWSVLRSRVGGEENNEIAITAPTATDFAEVRLSYAGQAATDATSDISDGVFRIVSPTEPATVAKLLAISPTESFGGNSLGNAVATAGDVNGDGFADVIIGEYLYNAGAGRALVYYGGPGMDAIPDLTLTGAAGGDHFGNSVSTAGDVNGDGFADVIVGAPNNDGTGADAGRAYVYFGGPGADQNADWTLSGALAGDVFGISVSAAGDVNGDGYADVIVGAVGNDAGGSDAGRAYVYFGGVSPDQTPDLILTGSAADELFGAPVAGAGDMNGDGYADVIVGVELSGDSGRARVYYGGPAPNAIADLTLTGEAVGDDFGSSASTAGDVNGDGYADVIVGAPENSAAAIQAGRAYVYFGGPVADATADWTLTGAAVSAGHFGVSVSTAGDVNGDGFADVIVGAYGAGGGAGRAYVYYGGPGADAIADWTLAGGLSADQFGLSVSTAGNVRGDGFADVIVGDRADDTNGLDNGKAYVYDFNRYFVVTPNGGETWNVGATKSISWLGAEPADVWLSVDGGANYSLLETGVGGAESNTIPVRVPHLPTRFARIKVTTKDASIGGNDKSDSLFTIQSSVSLLSLAAEKAPDGGVELTWSSDPAIGADGLAGYRLYRLHPGESGAGTRIGPELIVETRYRDSDGARGTSYRLTAVNGLQEELELGRATVSAPSRALTVWPSPARTLGELRVEFAQPFAAAGYPATDLDAAIFDLSGRRVATLAHGPVAATDGVIALRWAAKPSEVHAGVFFVRVSAPSASYRAERRIVLVP